MYDKFMGFIENFSSLVWGTPTIVLLIGTGVYLSFKLNFFQFTHIGLWVKNTFFKIFQKNTHNITDNKNNISPFQAISTALASTIGTGNIAGVATAISLGGPGAVFWMWISALFGMITSFSENVLGIYYRKQNNNGQWCGGPMVYIKEGLAKNKYLSKCSKHLSVLYAVFLLGASLGIGNMTQANSITDSLKTTFDLSPYLVGIVVSVITFAVISGGIKRIGGFTEKLVPFMALFYISTTLFIFLSNSENYGYVFSSVFKSAFTVESASAAVCGTAVKKCISVGFKRGVFSNEAGLGASVTVNSCSSLKEPCEQGMWGIFGVFVDTIIVCTMTAFVLLSTTVEASDINDAIKNISSVPQYVYIGTETISENSKVFLTDTKANRTLKLEVNENTITPKITETDKYTYTNVMKLRGLYDKNNRLTGIRLDEIDGVSLVTTAFEERFGSVSTIILSVSIVLFAFSTIIGWYFYGSKAAEFIFGIEKIKKYRLIYTAVTFIGSIMKLSLVWTVSDIFNGLMAIPNLIAIFALSGTVSAVTKNYLKRKKGENLVPMYSAYD